VDPPVDPNLFLRELNGPSSIFSCVASIRSLFRFNRICSKHSRYATGWLHSRPHNDPGRARLWAWTPEQIATRFASQKQAPPAQIALARLIAKAPWIVPIPGTTKLCRLEENLGGTAIELTADDMHSLEEASSAIKVEGERYPATHAKLIDR
jgi:hypothetical protein